jgi:hypothetical protein
VYSFTYYQVGRMYQPEAKFLVPDCGNIVDSGIALSYRPVAYEAWQAGTTNLCLSRLHPPGQGHITWLQV